MSLRSEMSFFEKHWFFSITALIFHIWPNVASMVETDGNKNLPNIQLIILTYFTETEKLAC